MDITQVGNIAGFDQQVYDKLVAEAKSQGVRADRVDQILLRTANENGNFQDAVSAFRQNLLVLLALPNHADFSRIAEFGAVPSPGALVLSLITRTADEQRKQNAAIRQMEVEAVAKSMKNEAEAMKKMAVTQLALGIASGIIKGISGGVGAFGAGKALRMNSDAGTMAANARTQGISSSIGGAGDILGAISQYVGTAAQAEFKKMEADQEQMRATREKTDNLDKSLEELIQKALSAADSIQQAQNQARAKILG